MFCVRCGHDAAVSSGYCPGCGAPQPAQGQAFRLDPARWAITDRVCGAATVVLFISLFLPWYSASASFAGISASSSVDALTAHGYLYLVLILSLLMIGYLVVYAGLREMPVLPLRHEQLLAVVAGINLLIAAIVALAPMARSWIQGRRQPAGR